MINFLLAIKPILVVLDLVFALSVILLVMLQSGKGGDIGSAFGVGNSQSLFGASGTAPVLVKLTAVFAILFVICSLSLSSVAKYESSGGSSVITEADVKAQQKNPVPTDAAALPQEAATKITPDSTAK